MTTPKTHVQSALTVTALLALFIAGCARTSSTTSASRPTESPLKASYVDTHMHVVSTEPRFASTGKRPATSAEAGDGYVAAASQLISLMDKNGVEKSILVAVPGREGQEEADEASIREVAQNHAGRLYWMGGGASLASILEAGSTADTSTAALEARAQAILDSGARGFGEMISVHLCMSEKHSYQYAPPDSPAFMALADVAARNDVPIDIHLEAIPTEVPTPANLRAACSQNPANLPASIPALKALLSHNPKTRIVWQHGGWDNTGYRTPELTRELLGAHPNLYVALRVEKRQTQVGTQDSPMPNRIVTSDNKIDPAWLSVFEAYPDRFVVGADDFITPSGQLEGASVSYSETWTAINKLPADLRSKIGAENSRKIYKLN
ncbi:MAG: hypothetical protein DCC49_06800 [Acidobacteria bacterium]|nr:MAG: hypothetical protein DCC49_06800 [Acidobacteriota bacterium]